MSEFKTTFETIRHGAKEGRDLSEVGVEQAKQKAQEILDLIDKMPKGAVLNIIPSNVGRAVETRNVIEQELNELCQGRDDIELISVQDIPRIEAAKDNFDKKYVITEIQPQKLLGFTEKTPSSAAFLEYEKEFGEDFVGKIWMARKNEFEEIRQEIGQEFPDKTTIEFNPSDFVSTPEEAAMRYLRLMRRMDEIMRKYFPNQELRSVNVGHNVAADFMVMAAMDLSLDYEHFKRFGEKFRQPIESSEVVIEEDTLKVSYRGQEEVVEKDLKQIIEELKTKSEERKEEWASL